RARADARAVRVPEAPLHAGAALGRRRPGSGGTAHPEAGRPRRGRAEPARPAVRLPLPHALPARARVGAGLGGARAAARPRRRRALRRLPPRHRRPRAAARRHGRVAGVSFTTRPELRGTFGAVASTHWLASASGMAVLERGGNAFDAACAAAFVLQVVEPHLNGPGGDLPVIFWSAEAEKPLVLCAQGVTPAAATIERFRSLGHDQVPGTGLLAACVPGAFGAWLLILERYGTWPLADVLEF